MTSGLEGVRGLVEEIAHQKPEKPDYWNSCSQCERNIDAAQEALATLPTPPAAARGDVRGLVAKWREQAKQHGVRTFTGNDHALFANELESTLAAEGVQAGEVDGEPLARRFHETYERLAPSFGYETRTETREFDPDSANGRLMIAVCAALSQQPAARGVVDGWKAADVEPPHNPKKDSLGTEYLIHPPTSGGDRTAFYGRRLGGTACWYRYGVPVHGVDFWQELPADPDAITEARNVRDLTWLLREAAAALEAAREDAERYRWLRSPDRLADGIETDGLYIGIESDSLWGLAGTEADAAIDQARGEGGPEAGLGGGE